MSLKTKAVGGVKWTAVSALTASISQLLLIAILARLLDKIDFGLIAISSFIIGFTQIFLDMGISNAIIHKQDVSNDQLNSLYWLNIFSGIIIFFVVFLTSGFIAKVYNEPKLQNIVNLTSTTFLIQPIGAQFDVLLRKELKFKSLAIRDVISKIIILLSGCVFGYLGFGVYSLVYSNIIGLSVSTILVFFIGIKVHKPKFHFVYSDIKPFLSFGVFQMGEKVMNYFNSQADNIIIGKFLGMEVLGTYNIAKNLVMRPAQIINPIITKVSFPVMAKVQNDIPKLKHIYLKSLRLMSSVNFPIFIFMSFFARDIVLTMFGNKWQDAISVLSILSIYSLIRSTGNPVGSLQLARGKADWGFYWNSILLIFVPLTIYVGSFWGVVGVCYAFLILQVILFPIGWKFMINRLCQANFGEYLLCFLRPLAIALVAASTSYFICLYFNIGSFYKVLIGLAIFGLLWIFLNFIKNKEFIEEVRFLIKGKT